MSDSEPATPFIPPRPDIGTPMGNSPSVLPSVIPMSPSQVGVISPNGCIQCSPPFNTASSLRAHPIPPQTHSTLPIPAHPLSRPPWSSPDLITCQPFSCRTILRITLVTLPILHRLMRLGPNTTLPKGHLRGHPEETDRISSPTNGSLLGRWKMTVTLEHTETWQWNSSFYADFLSKPTNKALILPRG